MPGGPGASEFPQRRRYLGDLERDWLVVDWDQPGAGRAYRGNETSETLSLEALVDDGVALVDLLAGDYRDRPVVLVRHSFGTVLGVRIAERTRGVPLTAKLRYLKAMNRSMDLLRPRLCEEVNFRRDVMALAVPVYLFAGRQDRITDLTQIEEWFDVLETPAKRLDVVDAAGHLNLYEKPDRFISFMDEVRASLT